MAACTGKLPDGALHLDDGAVRGAIWRFPHDPGLPGLAAASDPRTVAHLLDDLGFGLGRRENRAPYRPGRRAVIEASGRGGRLFIKVVRPGHVEALHHRHRLLVDAGVPAPQSLGWTADGLLVLQALQGRTLREAMRGRLNAPPSGEAIAAMLDRLPAETVNGGRHRSSLDRVGHYATVVGAVVPDQAARVERLASTIAAEAGNGPTVPVHGDFYEPDPCRRWAGVRRARRRRRPQRRPSRRSRMPDRSSLGARPAGPRSGGRSTASARAISPASSGPSTPPICVTGRQRSSSRSPRGLIAVQDRNWPALTRRLIDLAERCLLSARAVR